MNVTDLSDPYSDIEGPTSSMRPIQAEMIEELNEFGREMKVVSTAVYSFLDFFKEAVDTLEEAIVRSKSGRRRSQICRPSILDMIVRWIHSHAKRVFWVSESIGRKETTTIQRIRSPT